ARTAAPGENRARAATGGRRAASEIQVPDDPRALGKLLAQLENQMLTHARNLEFEEAAALRDQISLIREKSLVNPY
ncbi:MAG: UvrB/UvrC motif-containing protein, partial [Pseudomonadales bacterium]|nr:UvrB/UvrC motif-containing protein [Pseudomonadales bacterium]